METTLLPRQGGANLGDGLVVRMVPYGHAAGRAYAMPVVEELPAVSAWLRFEEHIQQAIRAANRAAQPFGVLIIAIDGLAELEQRYGARIGAQFLTSVSSLVHTAVRECDTVARIGDEEFGVLLPASDSTRSAGVARRVCEALAPLARLDLGVRVGVSAYPAFGTTATMLLRHAAAEVGVVV